MTAVELWLPVGAIGFYLYDSVQLLWQNELLLIRAGGRWRIQAESSLRISARRVVLPHPLLPHRPQFRAAWRVADERAGGHPDLSALLSALKPIGLLCQMLLWLLLLLAPLCWILGAGVVVLAQFALYYLLIIAALVLVFRRRNALALSTRAFWSLAFDVLACGPFAVNLLRKLSMRRELGDPVVFAAREFDATTRTELRRLIERRLDEEAAGEAITPLRQQQIAQWLASLQD